MKKIVSGLIGLALTMSVVSCQKADDELVTPTVEIKTPEKFASRGDKPVEIISKNFRYDKTGCTGIVETNYCTIPVRFDIRAKSTRARVEEEVIMIDPFFVQGGYVVIELLSADEEVLDSRRVWFDIIDTDEKIHAWGGKRK